MARLLILSVLCFLLGVSLILASFLASQELLYQGKKVVDSLLLICILSGMLQGSGGLLVLTSISVLSFYFCGSKKTKKRQNTDKGRRKEKPQEISRVCYG